MEIMAIKDKVLLTNKKDVLRLHLYFKFIEHKVEPCEKDMNIMLELYLFGGYSNAKEQAAFIQNCLDKGLKRSAQSLRNTLSKYVGKGVLDKPKNRVLKVNEKFIPSVTCDKLVLQHIISHAE